jgi:hypothetical protein
MLAPSGQIAAGEQMGEQPGKADQDQVNRNQKIQQAGQNQNQYSKQQRQKRRDHNSTDNHHNSPWEIRVTWKRAKSAVGSNFFWGRRKARLCGDLLGGRRQFAGDEIPVNPAHEMKAPADLDMAESGNGAQVSAGALASESLSTAVTCSASIAGPV